MTSHTLGSVSHDTNEQSAHGAHVVRDGRYGESGDHGHLIVVRATRADGLAHDLAQRLGDLDASNPLDECIVVLQGAGMHRWLRRDMANRLGAWGGVETPFLRKFLFDVTALACDDELPTSSRQDIQELAYRIAAHVTRASAALSARIAPFLAACRDSSGGLALETLLTHSHALAESFDRYEMDRPEMIASWLARDSAWRDADDRWSASAIEAESWQRSLWRDVVPGKWKPHEAWKHFYALAKKLESGSYPPGLHSIRFVSVFGVSTLPPSVFAFLEGLARHIPVCVHMLVPTEELIEDGASDRIIAKRAARARTDIESYRAAHKRDERNGLRETFGAVAFEAAKVIDALARVDEHACESESAPLTTLLAAVQQAVREDRPAREVAATVDASVQFHAVSSASRAAEVVHDEILRAFAEIEGLAQEEVAILVPSLAMYGGSLQALFARRAAEMPVEKRLSLRNADAAASDQSPVAHAAVAIMDLVIDDAAFAQVSALISSEVVCDAIGESVDDVRRQLDVIAEAGASRFFDAAHRRRWIGTSDAADDELHTIAWAIDRVILGTVAGDSQAQEHVIGSCRASAGVAGKSTSVFHAVGARIERLQAFAESVAGATNQEAAHLSRGGIAVKTIDAWAEELRAIFDRIMPTSSSAQWGEQRAQIDRAVERVARVAKDADLPAVEFAVARSEFAKEFESVTDGARFASGGITLARLSPMRSVPFRCIALVGVDRGVFPRPFKSNVMDIETLCPRAGDRNSRNDDLLLLLETIHAATDRLIVVYEGIEASTSRAKPASPVVDRLIETCVDHLRAGDGSLSLERAKSQCCRSHVPMADQPEAWPNDAPAGFDVKAHDRATRIALARAHVSQRSFVAPTTVAVPTGVVATTVAAVRVDIPSVREMARVLKDPVSAFVKASGLRPIDPLGVIKSTIEPIEFHPLHDARMLYTMRKQALSRSVHGIGEASIREELRLDGDLPHGASGSIEWNDIASRPRAARKAIEERFASEGEPLGARWKCDEYTFDVTGSAPQIVCETLQLECAATQLLFAKEGKGEDLLSAWLEHLAWCSTHANRRSMLVTIGTADKIKVDWRAPVPALVAAATLNEIGAWASASHKELMPFSGKLLHPWIRANVQTPAGKLARAKVAFDDQLEFDRNIPLAFRGQQFFEYASHGATPQTFVDIAAWLAGLLAKTGWEK